MSAIRGIRVGSRVAVLAALVVSGGSATAVRADDGGLGAFFREQFGIGRDPAPAPVYDEPISRPLIVRPHRRPSRQPAKVAVVVGPMAPVSIYDDKTLRVGDAVMTGKGLRVFIGGHAAPYTDANFVAVSDVDGLPRQVEKALLVIDKAPRT